MKTKILLLFSLMSQLAFSQKNIQESIPSKSEKIPSLVWKFKAAAGIIASPVIDENIVFFGSVDGILYAIKKENAEIKWKFRTYGSIRSTVCIDKEKLFLLSGDGLLYCLNKNSGKVIWKFATFTGFMGDRKCDFADYYQSSPVFYNNFIYFGYGDGNVYAVNSSNGELVWNFKTGDAVHTIPALYKDKLLVGSYDGNIYALNNLTGSLLWKFKSVGQEYFPKGEMMGNPVAAQGLVFAGSRDFNFYAIDINGGYCHWMKQFPKGWALPITVNDSVIYLGTSEDRQLLALEIKTGKQKWKTDVSFNIFGGCAIGQSSGYFGTLLGKLYSVDLKTGIVQWTFNTDGYVSNHLNYFKLDDTYRNDIGSIVGSAEGIVDVYNKVGAIFSTPTLSGDVVIFTSLDGNVYCLKQQG